MEAGALYGTELGRFQVCRKGGAVGSGARDVCSSVAQR
jgi:hypothetical protein